MASEKHKPAKKGDPIGAQEENEKDAHPAYAILSFETEITRTIRSAIEPRFQKLHLMISDHSKYLDEIIEHVNKVDIVGTAKKVGSLSVGLDHIGREQDTLSKKIDGVESALSGGGYRMPPPNGHERKSDRFNPNTVPIGEGRNRFQEPRQFGHRDSTSRTAFEPGKTPVVNPHMEASAMQKRALAGWTSRATEAEYTDSSSESDVAEDEKPTARIVTVTMASLTIESTELIPKDTLASSNKMPDEATPTKPPDGTLAIKKPGGFGSALRSRHVIPTASTASKAVPSGSMAGGPQQDGQVTPNANQPPSDGSATKKSGGFGTVRRGGKAI